MIETNVLQEMIDNHEKIRVIEENGNTVVKVRPKVIEEELVDKLSSDDISKASTIISKTRKLNDLHSNLHNCCSNISDCINAGKGCARSIPNGNISADVMFINKIPTDYEMYTHSCCCDKNGMFLSLILDKMNVSRESIYFTDMVKCNINLDEVSFKTCLGENLIQEIRLVCPKLIICNGLSVLKACSKMGVINNLSQSVSYGNIYTVNTVDGQELKITAIYDLDTVLGKTGDDYNKCKNDLWSQILNAFKSI